MDQALFNDLIQSLKEAKAIAKARQRFGGSFDGSQSGQGALHAVSANADVAGADPLSNMPPASQVD